MSVTSNASLRLILLIGIIPAGVLTVLLSLLIALTAIIGQQRTERPLLFIEDAAYFSLHDFQHGRRMQLAHNLLTVPLDFQWSPDGRGFVLYIIHIGQYEFYRYDLFSRQLTRLDIEHGNPAVPSWSADSQRLVYGSDVDGLCILTLATMQTECLRPPPVRFATGSPDGTRIAYFAGIPAQLRVMDVASSSEMVLAEGAETLTHAPLVWSPDSRSLIFQRRSSPREPDNDLYVIELAPSGGTGDSTSDSTSDNTPDSTGHTPVPENLTQQVIENSGFTFARGWSPDSQQFAYTAFSPTARVPAQRTVYDLYIYSRQDGTTRRITHDDAEEMDPAWSPDGRWLAYISSHSGHPTLMILSEADGSLVHTEPLYAYNLDWRP